MSEEKDKKQLLAVIEQHPTVQKGKKGLTRFLFSRIAMMVFFLLVQIAVLVCGYIWLASQWYFVSGLIGFLSIIEVVFVVNGKDNPAFKLVWVVIILLFPIFGTLLYLFIELQLTTKWMNDRLQKLHRYSKIYWKQNEETLKKVNQEDRQMGRLVQYMNTHGGYPVYDNSSVKYLSSGEEKFAELIKQLENAKKFIFLEYFIVDKGYMWDTILEILKGKAKEGVEVRFMYDGMNDLARLPHNYPRRMAEYGIQCHVFAPIRPALSTEQNNRDHRKIVVIDGKIAFTGGINLADEYINQKVRFGHWKDTAIMIEGEAVKSFTLMFLEMWNVNPKKLNRPMEEFDKYVNVIQTKEAQEGDGYVMPYGDSPLDHEIVGEQVYMDILYTAKEYVHIMTPYLILGHEMLLALKYAAKRGVDVRIMMPHIPDKWYAFVLAKTYYNELLEAGVKIYEYTPGFVHAKVFVSDDEKAVVGTINLDFRSLYLHFECAAMLYKNKEIKRIEDDFQETLKKCLEVTEADYKRQSLRNRIAGRVIRLLAPLM